jgi:hypothetical protein
MNVRQLKDVIITPALTALGLYSPSAANLLLGTAAQESAMGKFIVQQGIGFRGGIGIYQMEKLTYNDIWDRMVKDNVSIRVKMRLYLGYEGRPAPERMASDLLLSTMMARLFYYSINRPLPDAQDIPAMAAYYKKWFNTSKGAATEQQFIDNYNRYVLCE